MRTKFLQEPAQCAELECDTAGGWREACARRVNKHRAAAPGDAWPRIVIDFYDEVIEMIFAGKPIRGRVRRNLDRLVVVAIGRIFTPSVGSINTARRQRGNWASMPVRPPPEPPRAKCAAGRAAIALAFVGLDTAVSKRNRQRDRSGSEPPAPGVTRLAAYRDS